MSKYLIIPGYKGSDDMHWQTLWQSGPLFNSERIEFEDNLSLKKGDWVKPILQKLINSDEKYTIIAHSLGCLAFVHTYAKYVIKNVNAALLVAPPDVEQNSYALFLSDFAPIPKFEFDIPTFVVASTSDPYCTIRRAENIADYWNSTFINIGDKGHINSASRLGSWPNGLRFLQQLEKENSILFH
ncbi:MAG TPA: alpha/beta hydrolase [Leadbetterella sp.]|nr:alpha/beta hydrolase [Leadbetterella sp.]